MKRCHDSDDLNDTKPNADTSHQRETLENRSRVLVLGISQSIDNTADIPTTNFTISPVYG